MYRYRKSSLGPDWPKSLPSCLWTWVSFNRSLQGPLLRNATNGPRASTSQTPLHTSAFVLRAVAHLLFIFHCTRVIAKLPDSITGQLVDPGRGAARGGSEVQARTRSVLVVTAVPYSWHLRGARRRGGESGKKNLPDLTHREMMAQIAGLGDIIGASEL